MSEHYQKLGYNVTHFTDDELSCHCGDPRCPQFNDSEEFIVTLLNLEALRNITNESLPLSSAFRCEYHPIEAAKIKKGGKAGWHNRAAFDIKCSGAKASRVLVAIFKMGEYWNGIGVSQKGEHSKRFIHIDPRPIEERWVWSY